MELPLEELLKNQASDIVTLEAHASIYGGGTPAPAEDIKKVFYNTLKDRAKITHALFYNPLKKTYLSSIGSENTDWTSSEDTALHIRIDEVEQFKKLLLERKILSRIIYKTHGEKDSNENLLQ